MKKFFVCAACGKADDGEFRRATFAGAPPGGVLVHKHCLTRFFRELDEDLWHVMFSKEA